MTCLYLLFLFLLFICIKPFHKFCLHFDWLFALCFSFLLVSDPARSNFVFLKHNSDVLYIQSVQLSRKGTCVFCAYYFGLLPKYYLSDHHFLLLVKNVLQRCGCVETNSGPQIHVHRKNVSIVHNNVVYYQRLIQSAMSFLVMT